jgi:hypothetical protein
VAEIERSITTRLVGDMGAPLRPVIIDTYAVAAMPELPHLVPQT